MKLENSTAKAVCVYGASRESIASHYKEAAFQLGQLIAVAGLKLVSGGGRQGLMRCAIEGANSAGGATIGVLPRFMDERDWGHPLLTEKIVTEDMHHRKQTMAHLANAVVAMPGGCGTFEEILEMITWKKLGLFSGEVLILNTSGYYDSLIAMLTNAIDQGFMSKEDIDLWHSFANPSEVVEWIVNHI